MKASVVEENGEAVTIPHEPEPERERPETGDTGGAREGKPETEPARQGREPDTGRRRIPASDTRRWDKLSPEETQTKTMESAGGNPFSSRFTRS